MKSKILFSIVFLSLFTLLYVPATYSDNPAYPHVSITLANDTWDGHMVYEVDIYLLGLDGTWELASVGQGLVFNNSALGTGTVTATWVPGSSELSNTAELPTSLLTSSTVTVNTVAYRLIRIVGKVPPGFGNGSIISNIAPGTKLGRLRLTNTVDFTIAGANTIDTASKTQYPADCAAYVNAINTNLNTAGNVTYVKNLAGPLLPVELTSFSSKVSDRNVNLSWETKTELNTRQFAIERSLESIKDAIVTWSSVGNVQAAGNSTTPKKYAYTEKNLQSGKYQYRIKMIDNDGSFKYSSIVESEISLPKNFELSQNYPNPFNPSTRINYSLPFDSRVSLEVYNIKGEKMGQIVNEEQSAGFYTANFSSSALNRSIASGVYIYKLNAVDKLTGNAFTSIKKMMLLK